MAEYEFCVSLRITHPSLNPGTVTENLGLIPFRQWKLGEPRVGPKGAPLPGHNDHSYWAARLHSEKRVNSGQQLLEDFILQTNVQFAEHRDFFHAIGQSVGYVEYFVGWFGDSNFGASFGPELLKSTANLGVAIGLDVYPN